MCISLVVFFFFTIVLEKQPGMSHILIISFEYHMIHWLLGGVNTRP